jgi:F-type H+-transporting ATPase subunit c
MNSVDLIFFLKAGKAVGAGVACSGLIGAGIGIGLVFASLIRSYAYNMKVKNDLFGYAILGFALSEATGLLALMMSCIILYT